MTGRDPLDAFKAAIARARAVRQRLNLTALLAHLLTCLAFALMGALIVGYMQSSRQLSAELYRECLDVQRELIAASSDRRTLLDCRY